MPRLTATLPDGTTAHRKTLNAYTHVVAAKGPDSDKWSDVRWSRRFELAAEAVKTFQRNWRGGYEFKIVPVDSDPGPARKQVKLKATLPDGTVVRRTTYKPYTCVMAFQQKDGSWFDGRWYESKEAAEKSREYFLRPNSGYNHITDAVIIEVQR